MSTIAPRLLPILAVVALLVTGCAPTPTPVATPTPIASLPGDETVILETPQPLLDMPCTDLLEITAINAVSQNPVSESDLPFTSLAVTQGASPATFSLMQQQGTWCEWNNGPPSYDERGWNDSYSVLTVAVLPEAAVAWQEYVAVYGDSSVQAPQCFSSTMVDGTPIANCWWSGLTDEGAWVDTRFDGMAVGGSEPETVARFSALLEGFTDELSATQTGSRWVPPVDTLPIPAGCGSVFTADDLASAFGRSASDVWQNSSGIGGTSFEFEVMRLTGSNSCSWGLPESVQEYGNSVQILRGGEWAWNLAGETVPSRGTTEPLVLEGLADTDSAWKSRTFDNGYEFVSVDLVVGRNWVSFSLSVDELAAYGADDTAMDRLAQTIVNRLRASA